MALATAASVVLPAVAAMVALVVAVTAATTAAAVPLSEVARPAGHSRQLSCAFWSTKVPLTQSLGGGAHVGLHAAQRAREARG